MSSLRLDDLMTHGALNGRNEQRSRMRVGGWERAVLLVHDHQAPLEVVWRRGARGAQRFSSTGSSATCRAGRRTRRAPWDDAHRNAPRSLSVERRVS